MDTVANWFGHWFESLLPAFQRPSFAYEIAVCGLGLALLLIAIALARTLRSRDMLVRRSQIIQKAILSQPDNPRLGFAQNWQAVDTAMLDRAVSSRSSTAKRLRVAWEEFRETLVDLDKPEIRNTQRPQEYFDSAVRAPAWLDFCANLFVGAGLLLTFVGLVSALKEASGGISSPDAKQTQAALTHLLAVASTKFVTSIVGVGLSIILKIVDRVLERWLRAEVGRLCGLIERGLHQIPPQGLAAEQLVELRQQTTQLKSFATELAVAIGDKLNQSMSQAMTPVAASIENLAAAVDRSREEQMQAFRDGVGRAINGAASGELRALSEVLSGVSGALVTMQSAVSSSGDAAAKQIAGAADRFEQIAVDMRAVFEELARRISSMGDDVTEQGKAHAASLRAQFDALVANMEAASSKQRDILSSSATQFSEASGRAIADVFRATETAAQRIGESAAASMGAAADAASLALSGAGERIAASLDNVVSKAERVGEAFGRVDASIDRHVSSLNAISDKTESAAAAFKGVLQAVASSTVTTQQTTSLLREVVSQFEKGAVSAKQALDQTGALMTQIEVHQKRVNETWESYRRHFEGVDANLGAALQKWSEQHREALEVLNKHVNGIDGSMATAVSRLRDTVQPLSDLAEELSGRRVPLQAVE